MNNNNFSWNRVGLVARYYYPTLRLQIFLYPTIAVALGVSSYLLYNTEIGFLFSSLLSLVLAALIYFGPAIFAWRSNRVVETMLPATGAEKSAFIIPYCIILTLVTYGLYTLTGEILDSLFGVPQFKEAITSITNKFNGTAGNLTVFQLIQELVAPVSCMYFVFALRRNRFMCIVWTMVVVVAMGIMGGIAGMIWAFDLGFRAAIESGDEALLAEELTNMLLPVVYVSGILAATYEIVMIWLTHRKISRIQI